MASSRIFIKGLPPTISEDEFKRHFSAKHAITDAKLIPHRRIGYVGYKTPEDAAKAVKYFNRSFIRMSKIGVEIARPVSLLHSSLQWVSNLLQIYDSTLPPSRKQQREQERENAKASRKERSEAASPIPLNPPTKRKRSDVDEADPKLKEFLEVMQPASKAKTWATQGVDDSAIEPPTKMQALEIPEAESDEEYEAVPKKQRQKSPPRPIAPVDPTPVATAVVLRNTDEGVANPTVADATDDDWLRSRTNRLLDLMDPEEIVAGAGTQPAGDAAAVTEQTAEEPSNDNEQDESMADAPVEEEEEEKPDPILEAIRANGRLFVRNLPYTASEQDLRDHFQPFGSLEEVSVHFFCFSLLRAS